MQPLTEPHMIKLTEVSIARLATLEVSFQALFHLTTRKFLQWKKTSLMSMVTSCTKEEQEQTFRQNVSKGFVVLEY